MATPNLYVRGSGIYWWREMIDGTLYRRSTKHTDYKLAKAKAREFASAVRDGKDKKVAMPTFGAWVIDYLETRAADLKGAVKRDPGLLRPAMKALYRGGPKTWSDTPLDSIKRSDCERLLVQMNARGETFGTVWLRCIRIKKMFRLAIDDGLLKPGANPWAGIKLPKPAVRLRVLTRGEEEILKTKLSPTWSRFVTVAVGTGLSRGEMLRITPAHRRGGALHIPALMVKKRPARIIPLRPEVAKALDEQTPADPKKRYWACGHEDYPTKLLHDMVVSLGWENLTVHDLRRTFGTRCAEAGMPLMHLQVLMGHAKGSKITQEHYCHLQDVNVRDALLKLDL
jgi:integrase